MGRIAFSIFLYCSCRKCRGLSHFIYRFIHRNAYHLRHYNHWNVPWKDFSGTYPINYFHKHNWLIVAIPGSPTADFVAHYVSQVELTTICTAFLGYVGIAIGKDWEEFKRIGWRGVIVALLVITGTYLGSATIANITLFLKGMI